MPTFPAVERKIDDVPTAELMPEKYASWPVEPVSEVPPVERHVPLRARQPLVMLIPLANVEEAVDVEINEPMMVRP